MKVTIRREVDITKPINLRRLKPLDKIKTAIRKEISVSNFFINSRKTREQKAHRERIAKEDTAKEIILSKIYQELILGRSVNGEPVRDIVIAIDSEFKDVIFDETNVKGEVIRKSIFAHSDFSHYNIEMAIEDPDIRLSFPKMPYVFRCSRKAL